MSEWKQPAIWERAMRAKGHEPIMSVGLEGQPELNYWAWSSRDSSHNGPRCKKCGWSCCWHCSGVESITECECGL